ncbi:MAG: ABC transporter ATP-binding protein [Clostridia bacterium]
MENDSAEMKDARLIIDARDLRRQYGQGESTVHALAGVTLSVRAGEMVALMGPSGSGKSTLMQILGLLDRPTSGTYQLDGRPVAQLSSGEAARLRGSHIGFVFQSINLLPRLDAVSNVELPMVYARMKPADRRQRVLQSLERLGVGHLARRRPNQMSGGQAQRVAIARAIAPGPDLLLADEPTGALDRASGQAVLAAFQALNRDLGLTIVVVTHDPLVARHAGRIVELEDGTVLHDRPVEDRILAPEASNQQGVTA